jgi:hypothetical protein
MSWSLDETHGRSGVVGVMRSLGKFLQIGNGILEMHKFS